MTIDHDRLARAAQDVAEQETSKQDHQKQINKSGDACSDCPNCTCGTVQPKVVVSKDAQI